MPTYAWARRPPGEAGVSGSPRCNLAEHLRILRELAARDAENLEWQRNVGEAHAAIADVHVAEGKPREALDAFREQIRLLQGCPDPWRPPRRR